MTGKPPVSPLDRPAARYLAFAIGLAGIAFLGWVHRKDIFPPDAAALPADPKSAAYEACYRPQAERIGQDAAAGRIDAAQAELFKSRAGAFCADQAEKGRLPAPGG